MRSMHSNLESWEPSQHSLIGTGKPRKPYDAVVAIEGPSGY